MGDISWRAQGKTEIEVARWKWKNQECWEEMNWEKVGNVTVRERGRSTRARTSMGLICNGSIMKGLFYSTL